ncbi:MAG: hypothetical protein L0H83_10105 [Salinisphaera sp.]|nr:hypothetical protein [Salinisphaera sp.]
MKNGLQSAYDHIARLREGSGFAGRDLAVVPDHSRVQAYRYYDHSLQDGGLVLRFGDVLEAPKPQHSLRFDCDDDVEALSDHEAAFYRDARLVTVIAVDSKRR